MRTAPLLCLDLLGLMLIVHGASADEPSHEILPPKVITQGSEQDEVFVKVQPERVSPQGSLVIECGFTCTGGARSVFNGCLSETQGIPAEIILVSADGKVRHTLLQATERARDKEPPKQVEEIEDDRLLIRSQQSIGRRFPIKLDSKGETSSANPICKTLSLPEGEYFVQARYYRALIERPYHALEGGSKYREQMKRHYGDGPILVSKPARLIIAADALLQDAPKPESPGLRAELTPTTIHQKVPGPVSVRISLYNDSDETMEVCNPFFSSLHCSWQAVSLRFSNQAEFRVVDFFSCKAGSMVPPYAGTWLDLPPGGFVISTHHRDLSKVRRYPYSSEPLRPGAYFLELVAYEPLISGRPEFDNEKSTDVPMAKKRQTFREWNASLPGEALTKSNRVEIRIGTEE